MSNAIDANIAAGVDKPIQIHFPNEVDPTFYVRDSGIGMDAETLRNVFTYGGSDKRDTNKQIGGLGVGAKSPFTVTDVYTVESCKDGVKRTAICYRGEDKRPRFKIINEEETVETGTKVYFAVTEDKFSTYIYEAIPVLVFAQQMPEILNGLSNLLDICMLKNLDEFIKMRELIKKDIYIKRDDYANIIDNYFIKNIGRRFSGTIVNMGGVPYDVDISQVFDDDYAAQARFSNNSISSTLVLNFPIGSLDFQASREKLNYTEATKIALRRNIINFWARDTKQQLQAI